MRLFIVFLVSMVCTISACGGDAVTDMSVVNDDAHVGGYDAGQD